MVFRSTPADLLSDFFDGLFWNLEHVLRSSEGYEIQSVRRQRSPSSDCPDALSVSRGRRPQSSAGLRLQGVEHWRPATGIGANHAAARRAGSSAFARASVGATT